MDFPKTKRTTVRRLPKRGVYDHETVYNILDEGFICHVGFIAEGQPVVIPTGYARVDDQLFLHGSQASRMLRTLAEGVDLSVCVTLIDGLVLARSAFHHSINYRSVVIFGKAELVSGDEKIAALRALSEQIIPGRWEDARKPNDQELNATTVLRLKLEEVSAKVRTGPPLDDDEDYQLEIWAGVIPLQLEAGEPIADTRMPAGVTVPSYARNYRRGKPRD